MDELSIAYKVESLSRRGVDRYHGQKEVKSRMRGRKERERKRERVAT